MVAAPQLDSRRAISLKDSAKSGGVKVVLPAGVQMTVSREQFVAIALANPQLRLELSAQRERIRTCHARQSSSRF